MDLCPNKELCGSCSWSHIPYTKQLQQKLNEINLSFKLHKLPFECNEIIPSPKTNHYRNRMDFVINFEGKVGLRQKGKWWQVIDNHPCFIADEQIERLFFKVRNWVQKSNLTYYDRKKFTGLLRYAVIRTTSTAESMITIVTSKPKDMFEESDLLTQLNKLVTDTSPSTLTWAVNDSESDVSYGEINKVISGPGYIIETINGYRYVITPNSFFQTNSNASPILMNTVIDFAANLSQQTVVDLYCGSGFFSIPFSKQAKYVVGVELIEDAIKDARQNNLLNKTNVEFNCDKSENFDLSRYRPDLVIVDPPRSGLSMSVIESILDAKPKNIIYISCDYKSFTENVIHLLNDYRLVKSRAIDMFPHTPHVELVSELCLQN